MNWVLFAVGCVSVFAGGVGLGYAVAWRQANRMVGRFADAMKELQ